MRYVGLKVGYTSKMVALNGQTDDEPLNLGMHIHSTKHKKYDMYICI